jgi:hypothetical protein
VEIVCPDGPTWTPVGQTSTRQESLTPPPGVAVPIS